MTDLNLPDDWAAWFPDQMLRLPEPWRDLEGYPERDEDFPATPETITDALDVLDRSLAALREIPTRTHEELPEEFGDYSGQVLGTVTLKIPTFDEFRPEPFAELLERLGHDGDAQDLMLAAQVWVRVRVYGVYTIVLNWLGHALSTARDPELIKRFVAVCRSHWKSLPEKHVRSFMPIATCAARYTGEPSLAWPLIDEVLADPEVSDSTHEWARHLRDTSL